MIIIITLTKEQVEYAVKNYITTNFKELNPLEVTLCNSTGKAIVNCKKYEASYSPFDR